MTKSRHIEFAHLYFSFFVAQRHLMLLHYVFRDFFLMLQRYSRLRATSPSASISFNVQYLPSQVMWRVWFFGPFFFRSLSLAHIQFIFSKFTGYVDNHHLFILYTCFTECTAVLTQLVPDPPQPLNPQTQASNLILIC